MGEMTGINPPCMDWSSKDLPTTFGNFKHYCELIFTGPLNKKTDKEKVTYILLWLGQEGIRIYKSWQADMATPKDLFDAFTKHFEPKTNFRLSRFQLQTFRQEPHETIDDFIARCRIQAQKCKFKEQEIKERLIEMIIIGTRHKKAQEVLLGKDEKLTLDAALDIIRTQEATEANMKSLYNVHHPTANVDVVKKQQNHVKAQNLHVCQYCGLHHPPRKCPAYGTRCKGCNGMNHWQSVCRRSQQKPINTERKPTPSKPYASNNRGRYQGYQGQGRQNRHKLHEMTNEDHEDEDYDELHQDIDAMKFECLSVNGIYKTEAFAEINILIEPKKPAILKAKIDTGAEGNVLPLRIFKAMYPHKVDATGVPRPGTLKQTSTVITAYNQTTIPNLGILSLQCSHGKIRTTAEFYVVDNPGSAIIGLPTIIDLELITMNCAMETTDLPCPIKDEKHLKELYPDRFEGIGNFEGEYHIVIDREVPPVVHPPRRCPISIKDDIKEEIDQMIALDVIEPVQEPTDWVSSLVYVQKPTGKWRICLDPRDLNKAIKRTHTPTPTLDEMRHKFQGATVFSTLDAKHGYWSVKLDKESRGLTTFNSPFGRYQFKRLPFGLCISQDVFQTKMTQILEGCPGVIGMADDIAVIGRTVEEHDANLHHLMQVATKHGLIFNWEKCRIKRDRIRFYGLIFDKNGTHPDPERIAAIEAIEAPSSKKQLQEFLGIATYMSPFIPNLSALTEPLRSLLRKDKEFQWSPSHQRAFQKTKDAISHGTTLAYFDPKKEVTLEVDASTQGLGAALTQEGQPIAFASKSLTDAERRYANIEREMLAVVYACEKFHNYVYGRHFTVRSDHKPLEMIHLKNLGAAPPRLQRMLLRIHGYDMTIKYKPGKDMLLSDAMSRLHPLPDGAPEASIRINFVMFSDKKLAEIRQATAQDPELCALRDVILQGWPDERRDVSQTLRKYWPFRDELSIEDGILLKGSRLIIPGKLRAEYLTKIHEAHQGIVKCQLRAKSCIFWHGINKDIEELVGKCPICQRYGNAQPAEPLRPHEIPSRPWQVVAADIFMLEGAEYLLIADVYSKYPIVRKMPNHPTSTAVINALKEVFSEQGTPEKMLSDNGPQFSSAQFQTFKDEWNFSHVTSSPRYPQSNGYIERQVKTVKTAMKKAKDAHMDPNKALQCLRATPIDAHLPSPAELLLGRKIKTNLPVHIRNQDPKRDDVKQRLLERQEKQKIDFDKNTQPLPPLHPGQTVRVQNQETGRWEEGRVVRRLSQPRSYDVDTPSGHVLRRNRRHIRQTGEAYKQPQPHINTDDHHTPPRQNTNTSNQNNNSQYTTRYGRHVRKPDRLDL